MASGVQEWLLQQYVPDQAEAEGRVASAQQALRHGPLAFGNDAPFPTHLPLLRLESVGPAHLLVLVDREVGLAPDRRRVPRGDSGVLGGGVPSPTGLAIRHPAVECRDRRDAIVGVAHYLQGHRKELPA